MSEKKLPWQLKTLLISNYIVVLITSVILILKLASSLIYLQDTNVDTSAKITADFLITLFLSLFLILLIFFLNKHLKLKNKIAMTCSTMIYFLIAIGYSMKENIVFMFAAVIVFAIGISLLFQKK